MAARAAKMSGQRCERPMFATKMTLGYRNPVQPASASEACDAKNMEGRAPSRRYSTTVQGMVEDMVDGMEPRAPKRLPWK